MTSSGRSSARVGEALKRHQAGDLPAAESGYLAVLNLEPDNVDALHFLGLLRHHQSRNDEASELMQRALAINPDYVDALINLGNLHKLAERLDQAEACYARALTLQPGNPAALQNAAVILEARGQNARARQIYLDLANRFPQSVEAALRCAKCLRRHADRKQHIEVALACLVRAIGDQKPPAICREELAILHYFLDQVDQARDIYQQWLEDEPDNVVAQHMLAANGGTALPERASVDYVRWTFDAFAQDFDTILVEQLHYVAPQRLASALATHLPAGTADLRVLDAGCGTGLCGPLLRPYARELVGVDLSPGMIARAQTRGYDQLVVADLLGFLRASPGRWDLVASTDTLIYLGDLGLVAGAAAAGLSPGGYLAFTLEALPDAGDRIELGPSGRFRHSREHIESRLRAAGFRILELASQSPRIEAGSHVPGWLVVARRPL